MGFESNGILALHPLDFKSIKLCNFRAVEDQGWREAVNSLSENPEENFVPDPLADHSYSLMYASNSNSQSMLSNNVLSKFSDVKNSPFADRWYEAIEAEFRSLFQNNVWSEVRTTQGGLINHKKLVSTRWVFSVKYSANVAIPKARLVARGFQDLNQYSKEEVFSPVINHTVIRWIVLIANTFNLQLIALDVKTAFLYGDLESEVFISIPEGLVVDDDMVALKLNKAIYGLKVSSKIWFRHLSSALVEMGFRQFIPDQCFFSSPVWRNFDLSYICG